MHIFNKKTSIKDIMNAADQAAEWVCSDWPEGQGFQSSDRRAVYRSALRDLIGARYVEMWVRGEVELDKSELWQVQDICDIFIGKYLAD